MNQKNIYVFIRKDERLNFLEVVYSAPEDLYAQYGIDLGVLGKKRSEFDEMLVKKVEKKKKKKDGDDEDDDENDDDDDDDDEDEEDVEEEEEEEKEFKFTFKIPKVHIHR